MDQAQILLIERDQITGMHLTGLLQDAGHTVRAHLDDLTEARDILQEEPVDFVLLEYNPSNAEDTLQFARSLKDDWNLPFLYMTSVTDEDTIERIQQTKPVGFLHKPFGNDDLQSALSTVFEPNTNGDTPERTTSDGQNGSGNKTIPK